jgi:hypothetical protein
MAADQQNLPQSKLVQELFDSYESHKRSEIKSRRFTQAQMLRWMQPMISADIVGVTNLGRSAEGRNISLYAYGKGPTKVLLWSQMHGDEPTATMALLDILNFFAQRPDDAVTKTIRTNLTLLIIPMLNPDGAERFTRRTAQLIDMNRDAATLRTPEAQILRDTQYKHQPQFGFNLHDQESRLTVGSTKNVTAIALLAPARDPLRSDNDVRSKAKKVATVFAEVMNQLVPGHVAKYDDTFDRRAFGDSVQLWGTSTVLVESGGWLNDRDKMFVRKLNYVGLLASLYSIAAGEYEQKNTTAYEALPFNSKNLYDVIVRGVELRGEGTPAIRADIGINIEETSQEPNGKRQIAKVVDLGDLSTFGAFEECDGKGISIKGSDIQLDKQVPWEDLQHLLK